MHAVRRLRHLARHHRLDNKITYNHAELVGPTDPDQSVRTLLEHAGMAADAVNQAIDYLITSQPGCWPPIS